MDSRSPPLKPTHLLDDLESIRRLLDEEGLEPPLLTDTVDDGEIPLLCEVIDEPAAAANQGPTDEQLRQTAQLLMQEVIDDFVPQIEAELQRRLRTHLEQWLRERRP